MFLINEPVTVVFIKYFSLKYIYSVYNLDDSVYLLCKNLF